MPPRRFNFEDEISLRHLPDTSNVSFSFQIPNTLSGDDCLLDEDDMSFFRETNEDDVSGPDQSNLKTLTLEGLTRPVSQIDTGSHSNHSSKPLSACSESKAPLLQSLDQVPEVLSAQSNDKMRPNSKVTMQTTESSAENKSSAITRFEALRAEFRALKDEAPSSSDPPSQTNATESSHQDKPKGMSSRRGRPAMKTERLRTKAVVSGGIVKTRSNKAASLSGFARNAVSVPAIQPSAEAQNRVLSDNADMRDPETPDMSLCFAAPGGVAERLVMYSQTLLSSFGPATIHGPDTAVRAQGDPESSTQRRNSIEENASQTGDERDDPLVLSQISPSEAADPHPSPPAIVLAAGHPTRQSVKRPASVRSSPQAGAKKRRKAAVTSDDGPAIRSAGSRGPGTSSSSGSGKAERTTQGTRNSRRETERTTSILEDSSQEDLPTALARSDAAYSSSGFSTLRLSRSDKLATSGTCVQGHEEAGSLKNMGMPQDHERALLPHANTTEPVGCKFEIDTRIEARKAEFEKEKSLVSQNPRKQSYHQVPDFKVLHAAEEARLALRKEYIVPTVPLPFQFSTDGRVHERGKFEEHLREKERELKRVLEEKRREEEEREERAIKELRKKAVPRAHEVPEWYKDVPKRKTKGW